MPHQPICRIIPGADTAVLFLHGIIGTPDHFLSLLPSVPEHVSIRSILLDGHGKDGKAFAATSMKKWKAQVFSVVEEILESSDRVMIVGHSMGCLLAVEAAVRYPDRVAQLFLLSIPLRLRIPMSTVAATLRIAAGKVRPQDTLALTMQADGGVALEPGLWKYIPWVPRFLELLLEMAYVERLLPKLTVPAEAYHGIHDALVSGKSCNVLKKKAGVSCTVLPESDHFRYADGDLSLLQARLKALIEQYTQ